MWICTPWKIINRFSIFTLREEIFSPSHPRDLSPRTECQCATNELRPLLLKPFGKAHFGGKTEILRAVEGTSLSVWKNQGVKTNEKTDGNYKCFDTK